MTSLSPPPRRNATAFLIATWFGCGFAPVAPGTAGSLAGLLIAIALYSYGGYGRVTLLALHRRFARSRNLGGRSCGQANQSAGSADRCSRRSDRAVDHAGGRRNFQLEDVARGVRAVPLVGCLETRARAATRAPARRLGHRRRRCDGGALRRACYIRIRSFSSILLWLLKRIRMAVRRFPPSHRKRPSRAANFKSAARA